MENITNVIPENMKEKGQGLVEFALTLPLLLMLFFGIIEFGRLLFFYSAVTTAAREAARYGSAAGGYAGSGNYYQDCDGIRAAAKRIGVFAGVSDGDISITYDEGPGSTAFGNCPVGGTGPELSRGYRIIVDVSTEFTPIVPLVNLQSFDIESVARRSIFKNVSVN